MKTWKRESEYRGLQSLLSLPFLFEGARNELPLS